MLKVPSFLLLDQNKATSTPVSLGYFVDIFCLICLSLSDKANKIKPLNIEEA